LGITILNPYLLEASDRSKRSDAYNMIEPQIFE